MTKKIIMKNKIQIIGGIDEEMFRSFSEQLAEFEKAKATDVFIELSSPGGHAYDALAFFSRMRLSPCNITILAYGLIASAAVLVLAGGDKRLMTKESWLMVHEDTVHKLTAKVTEAEKYTRHMRKLEDQWNMLLAMKTRLSAAGWSSLHRAESYITPEDCLKYGLIEEIV